MFNPTRVEELRREIGAPDAETYDDQLMTMLEAFDIFVERNELRENLWADFPIEDAIHHSRSKLSRIEAFARVMQRTDLTPGKAEATKREMIEDALDLVNYVVMVARHATDRK